MKNLTNDMNFMLRLSTDTALDMMDNEVYQGGEFLPDKLLWNPMCAILTEQLGFILRQKILMESHISLSNTDIPNEKSN